MTLRHNDLTFIEEERRDEPRSVSRNAIPRRVDVPKLSSSFPASISPHATEAQAGHLAWTSRYGLYVSEAQRRLFAAMDIGNLASRMCPGADIEGLRLVADWSAWLLLRDDRWDSDDGLAPGEWERLAERDRAYLRVMRGDPRAIPPGSPADGDGLALALSDLCDRLRERAANDGMPDPVDGDFLTLMREFFVGSVRQASFQRRGQTPPLAEYLELRIVTGGLDILTKVQAVLDGVTLPPRGRVGEKSGASRLWSRLTETSHNICCWHNDLVSLNKELAAGEVHNLIFALMEDPANDCDSLQDAVRLAVEMLYEEHDAFAALSEKSAVGEGRCAEDSSWYAKMLKDRVSGIIAWHEWCARYEQLAR